MELYPVFFKPIIKQMIWGYESWDITCRPGEMGIVENGIYAGMRFEDYLNLDRVKTLGTGVSASARFPLLVKIIGARDTLSIQVHPDDAYARAKGSHDTGKSEMWYILEPPTEGALIIGLRDGITRDTLRRAYETGQVEEGMNYLPVRAGDMINIPAGLVHALTPGTVLAEIQQNSDTTYRLYDYNRMGPDGKPRDLHIEDALAVADFDGRHPRAVASGVAGPYFTVQRLAVKTREALSFAGDPSGFRILVCAEGEADITYDGGVSEISARRSVFLPAALGNYTLTGKTPAVFLQCDIPAYE